MHTAIVPATNMAELSEIPSHLRQRIKIHLVHTVDEALVIALTRPLAHARSAAVAPRGPAARVVTPPRRGVRRSDWTHGRNQRGDSTRKPPTAENTEGRGEAAESDKT